MKNKDVMELKIKTEKLKDMVSRAIKGAGNNKLIPITSLMAIELKDNVLTLITTDATNYLYIKETKVEGNDFYVVVPVDVFSKLISKMTCDSVSLTLSEKMNVLEIKGNGNYSIELPMDEEGNTIKYPNPVASVAIEGEGKEIHLSTVQAILNSVKPSLAVTLEEPCYVGYYLGDRVMGTDACKLASLDIKLVDEPMLIAPETMNLLAVMTSEKIHMDVIDNVILFTSPDCVLYSTKMEGLNDYAADDIARLLDLEFSSMCKIPKSTLLQVLDRLALFVSNTDKNGINLTFTNEGLQISSMSSSGVEIISYSESDNFTDFTCMIDIEAFVSLIKSQVVDVVTIYYGGIESAIKLVDGNLTQIIALMVNSEE